MTERAVQVALRVGRHRARRPVLARLAGGLMPEPSLLELMCRGPIKTKPAKITHGQYRCVACGRFIARQDIAKIKWGRFGWALYHPLFDDPSLPCGPVQQWQPQEKVGS